MDATAETRGNREKRGNRERGRNVHIRRYLQKENITKEVVETLNREVDPDKVRMENGLLIIEESW